MIEIELKDICKNYDGRPVLSSMTAVFDPGSCTLLTGRSGIGKTTLLNMIIGLVRPDSGSIRISPNPTGFGVVFQEDRLLESFTAAHNIAIIKPSPAFDIIEKDLKRLIPDLNPKASVAELSGGMRRRVAIARAVLSRSDVLIMDEPFTGLDAKAREAAIAYIMEKRNGRTLIIASHDLSGLEGFEILEVPEIDE